MEHQCITTFIAADLSAAFDTVDHRVLLTVLKDTLGVDGSALEWIANYLSERSFVVFAKGSQSDEKSLDFSVPQGSILGPVLFNAYSSTLEHHLQEFNVDIFGYADDHGLSQNFNPKLPTSELNVIKNLESTMVHLDSWMCQNRLKLNPNKTEFIYFGSRQMLSKCTENSINVVHDTVERVDKIRCLGVWFDSVLSFKFHITEKCQVAFLNIRNNCNALLYGLPDYSLNKLQRVQNFAAKRLVGNLDPRIVVSYFLCQ